MSNDHSAQPPFQPQEALQRVQRELRAVGLAERAGTYERRGVALARVAVDGDGIRASMVKRPSRNSPEWTHKLLKSNADTRDFVADLKKRLALWGDNDD
jgi:hypothetical protein